MVSGTKPARARVFISCGQWPKELEIAELIQKKLKDVCFDVYVAKKDHVLSCLTQNIFDKLENSEYFLFIDFKREKLIRINEGKEEDTNSFRGSLFTNQELAIATFLKDIDVLGFQEKGVRPREGIIQYTQINPIEFEDREQLPDLVMRTVKDREWETDWRNELQISFYGDFDKMDVVGQSRCSSHWYHLRVKNMNKRKIARNCIAYIEKIKYVEGGTSSKPTPIELKWKGLRSQSISIAPDTERRLDAFWYAFSDGVIRLGINPFIVDNNVIPEEYQLSFRGTYEIDYVVFSDNFSPSRMRLRIQKNEDYSRYKFEQIPWESE